MSIEIPFILFWFVAVCSLERVKFWARPRGSRRVLETRASPGHVISLCVVYVVGEHPEHPGNPKSCSVAGRWGHIIVSIIIGVSCRDNLQGDATPEQDATPPAKGPVSAVSTLREPFSQRLLAMGVDVDALNHGSFCGHAARMTRRLCVARIGGVWCIYSEMFTRTHTPPFHTYLPFEHSFNFPEFICPVLHSGSSASLLVWEQILGGEVRAPVSC